jgi:hypothetical protein
VKHSPRVISNDGWFGRWHVVLRVVLRGTGERIRRYDRTNFQRAAVMAAEEKRDARIAGLTLGCIVLACFALSALGMNY